MALESLTGTVYIDSLVSTNPVSGDPKAEGDDHLRGIKNVLKTTFPSVAGAVTATHTELNYTDVVAAGTVEASKAVVVGANKDALGFGKITGSTASGVTASFTNTSTTNNDSVVFGNATGVTGNTLAVSGTNASATGKGVQGHATHTTGANAGGNFQSDSTAGIAVNAVTTVAGGTPVFARAFDAIDVNPVADFRKGSSRIVFNPKTSIGSFNSIVQSGDQLITAVGATNLQDSAVITIAPFATDAVGIRINSVTDTVAMSGTIDATGHRVVAGDTVIYKVVGSGDTATAEAVYMTATTTHYVHGRCLPIRCLATGSIRIKLEHFIDNVAAGAYVRIVKNEVIQVEYFISSTTPTARSYDLAVTIGDVVTIQQRTTSSLYEANIQNCTICAATLSAAVC